MESPIGHIRGGVQKAAGPSDFGDDNVSNPALEAPGFGLAGFEDQSVGAGFVDDYSPPGVATVAPILNITNSDLHLFVIIQRPYSLGYIAETENPTDLLGHPPGVAFVVDDGGYSLVVEAVEYQKQLYLEP